MDRAPLSRALGGALGDRLARRIARHPLAAIVVVLAAYLLIEALYIHTLPLVMDEFATASHIHRLTTQVPYRDYAPYKTILGYALLAPPLAALVDPWQAMLAVKLEVALLTALALFAVTLRLSKRWDLASALLALLALCAHSTFLERSAALRVDMLTSAFGLLSFALLLERRWLLSALLAGISVLVSQKGVYFVAAGVFASAGWGGGVSKRLTFTLRYLLAALLPLAAYLGSFALLASWRAVYGAVIGAAAPIAFRQAYDLSGYWWQTLGRNPVFYGVSALGLLILSVELARGRLDATRRSVLLYGSAMVACALWHKQPWPYFFVLLLPTLFVVLAAVFSLGKERRWPLRGAAVCCFLAGAVAWPLVARVPKVLERDSGYQERTLRGASRLLGHGQSYLAGVQLLWQKPHVPRLSWLDSSRLYAYRDRGDEILGWLRASPPALVIDNTRLRHLPREVSRWLDENYQTCSGSIQGYAPSVRAGVEQLELLQSARYTVESPALMARPAAGEGPSGARDHVVVRIDGLEVRLGQSVHLERGTHAIDSPVRLRFVMALGANGQSCPPAMALQRLFHEVYDY